MELNLALVQMRIAPSDPILNMRRMEEFIRKAKAKGADLVILP